MSAIADLGVRSGFVDRVDCDRFLLVGLMAISFLGLGFW